jgi:hypothetical protein
MGFLDRLFGADTADTSRVDEQEVLATRRRAVRSVTRSADDRAIARYRYLLQTAPPETIEQVHAEAFAKLTDDQRALIYEELSKGAGTGERPLSSEPATLARAATRAELRVPGTLERSFAAAPGLGTSIAGSLLGTVAGYVIGSALVSAFLPWDANSTDSASTDGASTDGASTDGAATDGAATATESANADSGMTGSDVSGFGGGFDGDFGGDAF